MPNVGKENKDEDHNVKHEADWQCANRSSKHPSACRARESKEQQNNRQDKHLHRKARSNKNGKPPARVAKCHDQLVGEFRQKTIR